MNPLCHNIMPEASSPHNPRVDFADSQAFDDGVTMPMSHRTSCPFLPALVAGETYDHHLLGRHGERRDAAFYEDALRYGHALWHQGHAGRALLAITRALYADVAEDDPILRSWPLPYNAMAWIVRHHDSDDFPGNPRLSYQHQATRLRGERRELRSARAWAVWAIVCAIRPHLNGDPSCQELSLEEIQHLLEKHGHQGEGLSWRKLIGRVTSEMKQCSTF